MPIIASAESDKPRELPDSDLHNAVCCFAYDLGMYPDPRWGKVQHKVILAWELEQEMSDGRRFMLSKEYTLSLFDKALLFKHLTSWKGAPLSALELKGLDIETLVGKPCRIMVIHNTATNGKTYANIDAVLPPDKKVEAMKPKNTEAPKWFATKRDEYRAAMARYEGGEPPVEHDGPGGSLEPDSVPF